MTYIVNEQAKPIEFVQVPYLADPSIRVHERVTLAAVIYRNRIGKGASVPWLAHTTGFDRHTIRDHLQKLQTRKPVLRAPRASQDNADQPQALPKAPEPSTLEAGKEKGYVYKDDNGWHARCPRDTELHSRYKWQENATKPHWWDSLLTIRLPLPITNRKEIVPRNSGKPASAPEEGV